MKKSEIKKIVRKGYGKRVKGSESCCCGTKKSHKEISKSIGYSESDMASVPKGANLGLGCGNPIALASLKQGETVLDLGSGAGFDSFLAANKVGENGRVIGIDMTPEMIEKARENAKKGNYKNVEFRLGEIENIPADDNSVDVVISNCVINLSPDKKSVFKEAYRILKHGGRMFVSDIVLIKELPPFIKKSVSAYVGCVSGAVMKGKYLDFIKEAGFREIKVIEEQFFPVDLMANDPTVKAVIEKLNLAKEEIKKYDNLVTSIKISAKKE